MSISSTLNPLPRALSPAAVQLVSLALVARRPMANPIDAFIENADEAFGLIDIHIEKTGKKRGRRFGVEVLNKSCIVLMTASWEAFIEDCVSEAFAFLLAQTRDHTHLPKGILKSVAKLLKDHPNEVKVWDLASEGWKVVLGDYKEQMLRKHLGFFNTPKAENVDALFKAVLDFFPVSAYWSWKGLSVDGAKKKLRHYVELRGEIAHRVKASRSVLKEDVGDYAVFIIRLAVKTCNATRDHMYRITGKYPWDERSM